MKLAIITAYSDTTVVEICERPELSHGAPFDVAFRYNCANGWNAKKTESEKRRIFRAHGEIPIIVSDWHWLSCPAIDI